MEKKSEKKLKELISSVFNIKIKDINYSTNPDTVEKWDSLQQLNLAIAIEDEFKIKLSADDISDLLSYKLIKEIIMEKLKQ